MLYNIIDPRGCSSLSQCHSVTLTGCHSGCCLLPPIFASFLLPAPQCQPKPADNSARTSSVVQAAPGRPVSPPPIHIVLRWLPDCWLALSNLGYFLSDYLHYAFRTFSPDQRITKTPGLDGRTSGGAGGGG